MSTNRTYPAGLCQRRRARLKLCGQAVQLVGHILEACWDAGMRGRQAGLVRAHQISQPACKRLKLLLQRWRRRRSLLAGAPPGRAACPKVAGGALGAVGHGSWRGGAATVHQRLQVQGGLEWMVESREDKWVVACQLYPSRGGVC